MTLVEATVSDVPKIQEITRQTWPIAYGEILSEAQLKYMLDLFYSDEALTSSIALKEQLFYLVLEAESIVGFVAIEHQYKGEAVTKIHKIYLLPQTQGKGIGKKVIEAVEKLALEQHSKALSLNVNRFNTALHFYQKMGFQMMEEVNIDIGNGYLMEDYIMQKQL